MTIYLDDNMASRRLPQLLRRAGHVVVVPADVGLAAVSDPRHLVFALKNDLALLSANHRDFRDLHHLVIESGGHHSGVLLVYADNDPTKDMRPPDIVRAVGKLQAANVPLTNQLVVLNHWR